MRITSDNPLADPKILDKILKIALQEPVDYISNNLKRTFPIGYDIEVFSYDILKKIFCEATDIDDIEHVTLFIHKNQNKFKTKNFEATPKMSHPEWRLTIDEKDDFELIKEIFKLCKKNEIIHYEDLIDLFENRPNLTKINEHVKQKKT